MHPSLALFDLDGCLVDSTGAITTCVDHALERVVGLPPRGAEALRWVVGPPLVESFSALLDAADADAALVGACVDAYRERYAEVALRETAVIPGVTEVLDELRRSMPLAVVTSKPTVVARPLLEGLGLADRFVAVHGPEADHRVEPKATTLARALDDLGTGLDPGRAVMVGDRSHDVVAGRSCGTATVGVTWGAGDRAELEQAGADRIVDAPLELLDLGRLTDRADRIVRSRSVRR